MRYSVETIYKAFNGKLFGRSTFKLQVCEAVAKLPPDLIEQVTTTCWFISSSNDTWAFTIKGSEVADKQLVIVNDELLNQPANQIQFTLLHEIGHVILSHRNAIGGSQTQSEIDRQELEADTFANQFISPSG